jgi:hypothetical protein
VGQQLLAVLGIASAVVNTIGLVPYLRDIFRHKTKPERATWWIWLTLNMIAFFAQLAAGATWSLGLMAGQLLAVGLIAVLSLRFGYGHFHRKHYLSLAFAAIGVVLWRLTNDPLIALVVVIVVDFVAFYLTITKTWHAPDTETLSAWIFASIAGLCGLLAVGDYGDATKVIYPLYIFVGNSFLVWVIVYRRRVTHNDAHGGRRGSTAKQ